MHREILNNFPTISQQITSFQVFFDYEYMLMLFIEKKCFVFTCGPPLQKLIGCHCSSAAKEELITALWRLFLDSIIVLIDDNLNGLEEAQITPTTAVSTYDRGSQLEHF